ncbi:hypothetical protein [Nocardioides euryhalodurans]|uniref:Uncharacterized protein n=1 Tax=Nocardioides euryhalodurans TaxID=2518370 RepID=A0A4P7GHK4_9ACTN|nr:hypothetical protein [Nocardioides euryhalodurans]QBR91380.1 hypothetical protein EXE57_03175 [Nocardioides euryhalodurans]
MAAEIPPVDPARDEDLVRDFARTVLEQAAPEELVLFDQTAADYFRDPDAVLDPARRDESVGFGLDLALLTPYVLAVATPVLAFLVQTVATTAKAEATPVITDLVRRLFRAGRSEEPKDAPTVPPVTPEQARRVREVALARASDLGLPEDQARLLADSVVGGLVTAA